jgi:hypothetical protein
MTFNQMRKALLREMTLKAKGEVYERICPFLNDDVPKFLKELDESEEKARKTRLIIKKSSAAC